MENILSRSLRLHASTVLLACVLACGPLWLGAAVSVAHAQSGDAAPTPTTGPATTPPAAANGTDAGTSPQPLPAMPRPPVPDADYVQPIAGWQAELESLEKAIERLRTNTSSITGIRSASGLAQVRTSLERISLDAEKLIATLTPRLIAIGAQRAKLGPAPGEGAAPEAEPIAAERNRLASLASGLEGAIGTSRAIGLRAEQMVGSIQDLSRSRFAQQLLTRISSPLLPELWRNVASEFGTVERALSRLLQDWWQRAAPQYRVLVLVLLGGSIWFLLNGVGRILVQRDRRHEDPDHDPSFLRRSTSALVVTLARTLPTVLTAIYVYTGLGLLDLLPNRFEQLTWAALWALCIYAASTALVRALIAPRSPQWRLIAIEQTDIAWVLTLARTIAAVYALDVFFHELNRVVFAPVSITVAQSFVASVIFSLLLIWLAVRPMAALAANNSDRLLIAGRSLKAARYILLIAAVTIIAAAVLGYVALARFLAGQVIVTGSIIVAIAILHLAIRSLVSQWISANGENDDLRQRLIGTAVTVMLNLIMLAATVPLILLQWGIEWADLRSWVSSALFGFEIGGVRLSLASLLIGLALLVAGIFLTRTLQRWLDKSILSSPGIEQGLANSVLTGTGYLGIIASAVLAVSYAGIDFTNLAIVAGALSVGIGFGLQSVVNNFVSGLILLIERPIKVGDWITVGAEEGYVRRISVRSTEIETFDRSNVIIPNSELISGRVINWTHRNAMGRVLIRVGVAYDSDPQLVMDLLRKVADDHPKTLDWPQPTVVFEDFGASSLDFSLRAFIPNVNEIMGIKTEMRLAILKAFRDSGVEIPFPQQDLHLRDLDGVKTTLSRIAAERLRKSAEEKS